MSLYLEQIKQLVELQHVDDKIYAVKKELEEAPLQVESLREQFSEEEAKIAKIQDKLQHMYEQQKRLDMDLEDEAARLKKSKSKLMQVGNSKEFQAMSREMDNMERSSKSHEEERIALREEITAHEEMLKDAEAVRDELKIDLATKEESLNERIANANQELDKLNAIHEATGKDVPERILQRYDFIRHRFASTVLQRWLDEGRNLYAMLPYLRAYMGHEKFSDTAYYIHILPERLMVSPGVQWENIDRIGMEVDIWAR